MLDFDKFIGFVFFVFMALCGFWGIKFFALLVPVWLGGWFKMKAKEKKEELPDVGRQPVSEQENVELLFKK